MNRLLIPRSDEAMQSAPVGLSLPTPREREILRLVIQGADAPRTAQLLTISTRTVEFHRTAILRKLRAMHMVEAVALVALVERSVPIE